MRIEHICFCDALQLLGEARYSAEDIAGAVHQILSFIDVNYAL
jgi:hypothetical protein